MQNISKHFIFKISTLLLVFALLMPIGVKLMHIFDHHQHEVCNGEFQTHLHKADIECSFQKFKINSAYTIPYFEYVFLPIQNNHQIYSDAYAFLSDYQQLHFSLRGPPQIDLS